MCLRCFCASLDVSVRFVLGCMLREISPSPCWLTSLEKGDHTKWGWVGARTWALPGIIYGLARYGLARYGMARYGLALYGYGLDHYEPLWFGLL